jgi:hypothetical protein
MSSYFSKYSLVEAEGPPLVEKHCSRESHTWFISHIGIFFSCVTLSMDVTSLSLPFLLCKIEMIALSKWVLCEGYISYHRGS